MIENCEGIGIHLPESECDSCEEFLQKVEELEEQKQDKLVPGDGISIEENVISSALEGGYGISVDGETISLSEEIIGQIQHLLDCCEEMRTKLATEYYTKEEVDEIVGNMLAGKPVILGLTEAIVFVGGTFDPLAGVTAEDSDGNNITNRVTVTGTVDTSTPGEYELTYSVTDSRGNTTTEKRIVVVQEDSYHTTLFTDGTLIINELFSNRASNMEEHGAVVAEYAPGPYAFTSANSQPWASRKSAVLNVEFGSEYAPTSMNYLFHGLNNCVSIDLDKVDTSNTVGFSDTFNECSSLTTLDVSHLDTSSATTMVRMFRLCSSLTTLNVSNFDTTNVTNMSGMFNACSSLTTIDVSNFDTSSVTNFYNTFANCSSLTTLDVRGFDTDSATTFRSMFDGCSELTELDVSGFVTSSATDMRQMFRNCSTVTELDVRYFDTSGVTDLSNLFANCSALTSLDLSGFDTSSVTNMQSMFSGCTNLVTIYVSTFDVSNVTSSNNMFTDCVSIVGGAGTTFVNTAHGITSEYAYIDNPPTQPGYFTAK